MSDRTPDVTVLMSMSNGEPFLDTQVRSVLSQENMNASLIVRDDGSSDSSVGLVSALAAEYPGRIELICGEDNLGPAESFLQLAVRPAGTSEWYAFCDQDDVWLPDKLARAVEMLQRSDSGEGQLYTSVTTICDESLNVIGKNTFPGLRLTVGAEFARHRLAGHTMVFNESLLGTLNGLHSSYGFPLTRYGYFIGSTELEVDKTSGTIIITSIALIAQCIAHRQRNCHWSDMESAINVMSFLAFIAAILSFSILLMYRIQYYFIPFVIVSIPLHLHKIENRNARMSLGILIVGSIASMTLIGILSFGWYGMYPAESAVLG